MLKSKTVSPKGTIEIRENFMFCLNKRISLDKILVTQKVKITESAKTKKVIKTETVESYPLREISVQELKELRKKKYGPGFVLKVDEKLFYAKIPYELHLVSSNVLSTHLCAKFKHECDHLSAAEDIGCEKVRDYCWGIEKYPFIKAGYETFNVRAGVFNVSVCANYEEHLKTKKISPVENNVVEDNINTDEDEQENEKEEEEEED